MSLRIPSLGRASVAVLLVLWLGALAPGSQPLSSAAPSPSELEAAEERLNELEREFELVVERYNLLRERLQSIQTRIGGNEIIARRGRPKTRPPRWLSSSTRAGQPVH
jgi:tetrahydromethanopterin S-methyltransferase subunit G